MKNWLLLTFITLPVIFTQAQFLQTSDNAVLREKEYVSIEGSPYLFKEWKTGSITDQAGSVTDNILIRYDSYRDEIQFMRDGKTLVAAAATAREFKFNFLEPESESVVTATFRNGFQIEGYSDKNYFQVIYDGEMKVLKKIKTVFNQETVNSYGTNEVVKKFSRTENDFLWKNGEAVKLGKHRKDLLTHFGEYEDEMKNFVKKNKFNVKSDVDLMLVMTEYERLLKAGK
jgi:hypothetical protein